MGAALRRRFLKLAGIAGAGLLADLSAVRNARAQDRQRTTVSNIDTPVLSIAYEDSGDPRGFPVILLHGFPDDTRAFDEVVPPLTKAGHRALVPYIRGFGATRFRDAAAPRMAQQAAIGQDVVDFADALRVPRFALAGYDWGGRAAAIVAALHPDRVRATVLIGGYTVQNTVTAQPPAMPQAEHRIWYQYYFNTERGRAGLAANRHAICRYLWQQWSPNWRFTDETYNRTAPSFDNPDFVDVVIHSYRVRYGYVPGDPSVAAIEDELAARPKITVPAITLQGLDTSTALPEISAGDAKHFTGPYERRTFPRVGHNIPREAPRETAAAVAELARR